ncbi:DNA glycosylase [Thozetella sp. PMI_491]|nr:DNA glycosylase [Thozetella sp. PMI_491]
MSSRRSARLSAAADTIKEATTKAMPPPNQPPARSRKRKAPAADPLPASVDSTAAEAPSTPQRRRVRKDNPPPPPATPTPSAVGLIAEGTASASKKPRSKAVTRLADPNATNAPLLSPETSRIIASKPLADASPSKAPASRITTANILKDACEHLIQVDERMRPLVEKNFCRVFSAEGLAEQIDPFESLASGIISQQVATKSLETLRTAGLSQRKAEYVQGLAEKFVSGELSASMLADAPYEEVLEKLIAVRGLGRWSVEMFACFGLKRLDVFSLGDLGVQRGMAAFVGRDVAKLKNKGGKWKYMSEKEMEEISDRFKPYRSVFMWYMWRVEETDSPHELYTELLTSSWAAAYAWRRGDAYAETSRGTDAS